MLKSGLTYGAVGATIGMGFGLLQSYSSSAKGLTDATSESAKSLSTYQHLTPDVTDCVMRLTRFRHFAPNTMRRLLKYLNILCKYATQTPTASTPSWAHHFACMSVDQLRILRFKMKEAETTNPMTIKELDEILGDLQKEIDNMTYNVSMAKSAAMS